MKTQANVVCRYCETDLTFAQSWSPQSIICSKCGFPHFKENINNFNKSKMALLFLAPVLFALILMRSEIFIFLWPGHYVKTLDTVGLRETVDYCQAKQNNKCLLLAYQQWAKLEPHDVRVKANYAFQLTHAQRYHEAAPIYKGILQMGVGTYDLMLYYAENFEGLGQRKEAIKWYEKTLGLQPNLLDVTQKLSILYVAEKRPFEAISLLKSYIQLYPEAAKSLDGYISADLEILAEQRPMKKMRLVGLPHGQFGLPITLQDQFEKTPVFLVDTGASLLTLPTQDLVEQWPDLINTGEVLPVRLADGRIRNVEKIIIPKLKIGPWEFKHIPAVHCDHCERLAGMSLLKKMKLETSNHGGFISLTLSH